MNIRNGHCDATRCARGGRRMPAECRWQGRHEGSLGWIANRGGPARASGSGRQEATSCRCALSRTVRAQVAMPDHAPNAACRVFPSPRDWRICALPLGWPSLIPSLRSLPCHAPISSCYSAGYRHTTSVRASAFVVVLAHLSTGHLCWDCLRVERESQPASTIAASLLPCSRHHTLPPSPPFPPLLASLRPRPP